MFYIVLAILITFIIMFVFFSHFKMENVSDVLGDYRISLINKKNSIIEDIKKNNEHYLTRSPESKKFIDFLEEEPYYYDKWFNKYLDLLMKSGFSKDKKVQEIEYLNKRIYNTYRAEKFIDFTNVSWIVITLVLLIILATKVYPELNKLNFY
jgi:hypothetical protein